MFLGDIMHKKGVKQHHSIHHPTHHVVHHSEHHSNVDPGLLDLNLTLQNKNIDLLNAIHSLAERIDKLVEIFEEAAKNISNANEDTRVDELTKKLDDLLDQNKNLSNGLMMVERYVKTKSLETPFKRL